MKLRNIILVAGAATAGMVIADVVTGGAVHETIISGAKALLNRGKDAAEAVADTVEDVATDAADTLSDVADNVTEAL